MAKYNKINWLGGINQYVDPTKVDPASEYFYLSNGRTRRNRVDPIYSPLEITEGLPVTGNIQGIYSVDYYLIVFINGLAYYRDYSGTTSTTWNQIYGFAMSATASRIYLATVPASYANSSRVAVSATDASQGVALGTISTGSPQCAIAMDGESQPYVIFPDASSRAVHTYQQWTTTDREYVPAACILPLWFGNILYCIGKDSKGVYNQIYRSVSGRPLDFVVAVAHTTGDKTSPLESIGGAPAMSYRVDYGAITALSSVQSNGQAFLATTARNSYLVVPDYTRLVFGEPTFSNQPLFPVGALNEQCVVDILADTAVIHYSGIRSFNAILNLKFEGKNAPFSRDIDGLLSDITQTSAAAVSYDNYAAFSLTTKYGAAIVWYDTLTESYASIDQFEGVELVKQFAVLLTRTDRRLFFVTTDNRMFEYFGADTTAACRVYVKDFVPEQLDAEHSIVNLRAHFTPPTTSGYVQASVITDGRLVDIKAQRVATSPLVNGDYIPAPYAISSNGEPNNIPVQFGFKESVCQGYRTGVFLEWDAAMALTGVALETSESSAPMPEVAKFNILTRVTPSTLIFIGGDGDMSAGRIALNKRIKSLNPDFIIGTGNHAFNDGSEADIAARFEPYWGNLIRAGKFYASPGSYDLNTDHGEPFFSYLRQAPTRYFVLSTPWADVFMMNSGYRASDSTQIEPDNLDGATFATSRQAKWLETALAASTKHKLVVWHTSPYTSSDRETPGKTFLRDATLASWGATAHISGSGRLYERLREENLTWYVNGCGTTDLWDDATTPVSGSQAIKTDTLGYLRMRVWPLAIETAFVDVNGVEYDNFVLRR